MSRIERAAQAARALQPGHQIELLTSGSALFAALVEAIDAARAEVLVETYIFDFAGSVLAVAEALERAAARGVCVRVVVDGIGTDDIPAPWQERWKAAGLFWRVFNPAHGWRVLLPAVREIMDSAPPHELEQAIRALASDVPGVLALDKCRIRKMGLQLYIDLHVKVEATITVSAGHDIAHAVKDTIREARPEVADVLVHIEPAD